MMNTKININKYLTSKKRILQEYGYNLSYCSFYNIINDFAFCIVFTNATMVYCDYHFVPLFMKSDYEYFTYGDRMETYTQRMGNTQTLLYSNNIKHIINKASSSCEPISLVDDELSSIDRKVSGFRLSPLHRNETGEGYIEWVDAVFERLTKDIIPFFESISNAEKMLSTLDNNLLLFRKFIYCNDFDIQYLKIILELYTRDLKRCKKSIDYTEEFIKKDNYQVKYRLSKINEIKSLLTKTDEEITAILKSNVNYTINACRFK